MDDEGFKQWLIGLGVWGCLMCIEIVLNAGVKLVLEGNLDETEFVRSVVEGVIVG